MVPDLVLVVAGLGTGILVGLTGMGGGALLTPLLVLGFGVPPTTAIGSDLVVAMTVKPVGAAVHQRAGTVRWGLVGFLLPTALPAAFFGAWLVAHLGEGPSVEAMLRVLIGVVLIGGVFGALVQGRMSRRTDRGTGGSEATEAQVEVRPLPTLAIGLVGGLIVGCTSVGSGSLIIVLLLVLYPTMAAKDLIGTDLAQAVPLVAVAAVGHLIFGDVHIALVLPLLLGALPGAWIGARLCTRVSAMVIKRVLLVVLTIAGLQMWHVPVEVTLVGVGLAAAAVGVIALRRSRLRMLTGGTPLGVGD